MSDIVKTFHKSVSTSEGPVSELALLGNGLPDDLETITIAKFDALVANGEIFYKPPRIEVMDINGLQVLQSLADLFAENPDKLTFSVIVSTIDDIRSGYEALFVTR